MDDIYGTYQASHSADARHLLRLTCWTVCNGLCANGVVYDAERRLPESPPTHGGAVPMTSTELEPTSEVELDHLLELSKMERATDSDLRNIASFDDALAYVEENHGGTADISEELGNGFTLLNTKDKSRLCGVPLVLVNWKFHKGDMGVYAFIAAVTKDGGKYLFSDGSTGIRDQLIEYSQTKRKFGGLMIPHGLRKSEYEIEQDGNLTPAVTYYLDTSAL